MDFFSFEKLTAYQKSRSLVVEVYRIVRMLPSIERFALGQQIQRSITSITSNLAEGCRRMSVREKIHFVEIAYGSLLEAYCQLQTCYDLEYISDEKFQAVKPLFFEVSRLLTALRQSYISKLSQ